GTEREREFVVGAPWPAEVGDIAGLETVVVAAPPVGDGEAAAPFGRKGGKLRLLVRGERRVAGVAEQEGVEALADPRGGKPGKQRPEIADHPLGRLVPDTAQDGGLRRDRLVATDARGRWKNRRERIAREAHYAEADGGNGKADDEPGQRDRIEREQCQVHHAEAAR